MNRTALFNIIEYDDEHRSRWSTLYDVVMLFGVAVIALPSGVITASYLDELREQKKNR